MWKTLIANWDVVGKGSLYFMISFLPAMIDYFTRYSNNEFTDHIYAQTFKYLCMGLVGGLVAIKAFVSTTVGDAINDKQQKELK